MSASRSVRSGSSDVSRMGSRFPVSRTPSSKFSRISICRYPCCRAARRYSTEIAQSSPASYKMAKPADSFSQVGITSPHLLSSIRNSLLSFLPHLLHSKDDMFGMLAVNPGDTGFARDFVSLSPRRPRHLPERKRSASSAPRSGVAQHRIARVSTRDQREDCIVSIHPSRVTFGCR